jgi:hypothetical protein
LKKYFLRAFVIFSCQENNKPETEKPKYILYKVYNQPYSVKTNIHPSYIVPERIEVITNEERRYMIGLVPKIYTQYTNALREKEEANAIVNSNVQAATDEQHGRAIDADVNVLVVLKDKRHFIEVGTNYKILDKYKAGDLIYESDLVTKEKK